MDIVKVENLTKVYEQNKNKIVAINDISFTIEEGEFVAIVGASGSGKSTLLHLLGGVDIPTSGKVYICGQDIYTLTEEELAIFRRRNVGLIYQFYNLIPVLNVEENIMLPCDLDNKQVSDEKIDKLLNLLDLTTRRKHLPNELSGGQQQRTAIGRALISNPAIILADEPTGNLDSDTSIEIMNLLKKSNEDLNQTLIIITHDKEIAMSANRVITIKDGRIISDERNFKPHENKK